MIGDRSLNTIPTTFLCSNYDLRGRRYWEMAVHVPKKVGERIKSNLSKYKRILKTAKDKDIKEANTVPIIRDMLADMMGWDKFSDITKEYEIKRGFCDLGIKINDKAHILVEVKAIGVSLGEKHLRQLRTYANDQGADWIILTNGAEWEVYKVLFRKPITTEMVFTLNFLEINARNKKAVEQIYSISKEGSKKGVLNQMHEESQVTNCFVIAGLIMSEPVIKVLKREIKKLNKSVKVDDAFLLNMLKEDVLKGVVVEDEKAKSAQSFIKKRMRRTEKKT